MIMTNLDSFRVLTYNVRSLRKNFDFFLCQLETLNAKPHVIILTEIWIYQEETNLYSIDGYKSVFNCNNKNRSGGVVAYVAENLGIVNLHCLDFTVADVAYFSVDISNTKHNLLAIYRSPSKCTHTFITELKTFLEREKHKRVIVTGDINIDIFKTHNLSREAQNYLENFAEHGFIQFSNGTTRNVTLSLSDQSQRNDCTEVDHFFVRDNNTQAWSLETLKWNLTDHFGLLMTKQNAVRKNDRITSTKKEINYALLDDQIATTSFDFIYQDTNI